MTEDGNAPRARRRPRRPDLTGGLRTLFSFQLRQLANVYSRGSAAAYARQFGLTMNEWRVIALVQAAGPLSINRLAGQAQFDRGLTSRLVRTLVERGIFRRDIDVQDARGTLVSLTPHGLALVAEVVPDARQRNQALLACLTPAERQSLHRIMDKLTVQALRMLEFERTRER